MPRTQTFRRKWLVIVAGRVKRHFNATLNIPVRAGQATDIHAETACERRPHLLPIQLFAFDFTGFDHVLRKGAQNCFLPKLKPQRFHTPQKTALSIPNGGKPIPQAFAIPAKAGPVFPSVDKLRHSTQSCVEYSL